MKIINGYDLVPPINTVIAIANDGINYTKHIQKVSIVAVEGDIWGGNYIVIIGQGLRAVEVNLGEVTNQPTWTNDPAGLAIALADINQWLAVSTTGYGDIVISEVAPTNPSIGQLWIQI